MLAKTPPMGFNTWNTFGENINEQVIKEAADAMVEKGLLDAGYEYLVIDDCWAEHERDKETGRLVADKKKFPNGMKAVSDYVHSKGLKFGMYSCCGIETCAGYPSSLDNEYLDAQTFADWGVDFLKYDNCNKPEHWEGQVLYRRMGLALRATGRDIVFSACNWGTENVEEWIRSTGAHMYRSTGDIFDNYPSFRDIALSQKQKLLYSAPGCFNDMDMLTVGMYGKGNVGTSGCNDSDYKMQFAVWSMFSSPLMLGCDVRNMTEETYKLITNKNLIRINQDIEGRPAYQTRPDHDGTDKTHSYCKILSDGEIAIMFTNFADNVCISTLYFDSIGIPENAGYSLKMTDAFTNEEFGTFKRLVRRELQPHTCEVYLCKMIKD